MEIKRDIYHLWIQYTTKNDEKYFRQFISGFVLIWEEQLNYTDPPKCEEIVKDQGPHLSRLPDELLPAIGKFLIIAKDKCENGTLLVADINETTLLLRCLCVMCKHFDNIKVIAEYQYISTVVAITLSMVKQMCHSGKKPLDEEIKYVNAFYQLFESVYDPYLSWRNFLHGTFADFDGLDYPVVLLHVEIVPCIYDCFLMDKMLILNSIGKDLIHTLGAIISGSQLNGMRAICPATISIVMDIISKWESLNELRTSALMCLANMIIVLQKTSPEQRQIDLVTIFDLYINAIQTLLRTEHFLIPAEIDEKFEICDLGSNDMIDVNALVSTMDIINKIMSDQSTKYSISEVVTETNLITYFSDIPKKIQEWDINKLLLHTSIVKAIVCISHSSISPAICTKISEHIHKVFDGIKQTKHVSVDLLEACLSLACNELRDEIKIPEGIIHIIHWIPDLMEKDQLYLITEINSICLQSALCKNISCKNKFVFELCEIMHDKRVASSCCQIIIKTIAGLAKYSIHPIELKKILDFLNTNRNTPYFHDLTQILAVVAYSSMPIHVRFNEFINIQRCGDGICVPDISKWTTSGPYGFVFHAWIRLYIDNEESPRQCRRVLLSLMSVNEIGYEVFIEKSGLLVVGVHTKNNFLAATVPGVILTDEKWHSITICIIPPKRPFGCNQLNVFIDSVQKLGATLKTSGSTDPFQFCTIGCCYKRFKPNSNNAHAMQRSMPQVAVTAKKSITNFMEKSFLPQIVPNYFTLPLRSGSSNDPNVKCYPAGVIETVYGQSFCLQGDVGSVLMAESTTNLKALFDAGLDFPSILSQDIEPHDLTSKFIFCYSPTAYYEGLCPDLVPGNKYNGFATARFCQSNTIQDCINCIGGMTTLFPILELMLENKNDLFADVNKITQVKKDWLQVELQFGQNEKELILMENPEACFLCILRYLMTGHRVNQEHMLNADGFLILSSLLQKCCNETLGDKVLVAVRMLVECIQNQQTEKDVNLLESVYTNLVFNFEIWSRSSFEIQLTHIQYIGNMIKNDRIYYRKYFSIGVILDVIRQYYVSAAFITTSDAQIIRMSLMDIIRYYLQKDVNIKEITSIISYIISAKHEQLVFEMINLLTHYMNSKHCKDQIYLLMHEPHTSELLYNLLVDPSYGQELRLAVIQIIAQILYTKRVSKQHKGYLRLLDSSCECRTLYPGLFASIPVTEPEIVLRLLDQALSDDSEFGYCGALHLLHNLSALELPIKLEVAKKLLTVTFVKKRAPLLFAKQIGWQESIARLLIKSPITCNVNIKEAANIQLDIQNEPIDEDEFIQIDKDLITFEDFTTKEENVLTELQATVTEAATVLEQEIKDIAGSVSGVVVENIASVYSIIRQTTSDIHDTFDSFGGKEFTSIDQSDKISRSSSVSMLDDSISQQMESDTAAKEIQTALNKPEMDNDNEDQLVYLVSNILFTILWRGIGNTGGDTWKERGCVMACINLLGLNNELYCSHLTLRLRLLEMGVQASLIDLSESSHLNHQQNAVQLLRMIYDLVVLDPNEEESKKCSAKLLDGVLALLDLLMVFQPSIADDWTEMIQLSLGLLLKCAQNPDQSIVAMATAKLHTILQNRITVKNVEVGYLLFSINKCIYSALKGGNAEQYSFLVPIMKALLEKVIQSVKSKGTLNELPSLSSGPLFYENFQTYIFHKEWISFIDLRIKPLYDKYMIDVTAVLWEPLNVFWAECYEACKFSSQRRAKVQNESRKRFQQTIMLPCRIRQSEETSRLNFMIGQVRAKETKFEKKWLTHKRFLNGIRGPWSLDGPVSEFWKLSRHENLQRMRLKLEPANNPDLHTTAANLRDNAVNYNGSGENLSTELSSTLTSAVVKDILLDDEVIILEEEMRAASIDQQPSELASEKMIISEECELVTLMNRVKGKLEVTSKKFIYTDMSATKEGVDKYDFKFPVSHIREVHLRKYNLRRSALEIFLIDQTSYFLNFPTKVRNKIFTKILSLQPPNILYGSGRSPAELLKVSGLTQQWINREISNFEYLMQLNTIAGRSYNDLSQYPVFPWILADYSSEILDLTNPRSFRDLSKPVGVINPKNEKEVRAKYDGFEDPSGLIPKFHYGTHYSNSAGVLHYMLRVEPFTSLHIELQSGRFDVADRQFHSIPQTWKLLMDNPNDVKELIPEFFYFPEFLKNMNKFDLGILQITKERVNDVILPQWAKSAEDFIAIHRRALESEYVSQNLHNWIDLIFGYKQRGPKASEALNVFYYCSYEGAVDLDKISNIVEREAVEGMINNFGQTPSQLLREPHPRRLTQDEIVVKLQRFELKRPDICQFFDRIITTSCHLSTERDPIIFLSPPRSPPRSFLQTSPDVLVTISKGGVLGYHSWTSYDRDKGFVLEIDATTTNIKNRKKLSGPFHPSITINSQLFAVSADGKYLYAGGIWDNSLRVFNIARGKAVASAVRHLGVITCLALDICGSNLVTGSTDFTCIVWSINNSTNVKSSAGTGGVAAPQLNTTNNLTPQVINTLYGHDTAVTCVAISTELDVVVSGSLDGTVNVHTIDEGAYIRTLKPMGCTGLQIEISFLTLSYQGHIAFAAFDDRSHSIHVYSVNGAHLGSKYVSARVTALTTTKEYLLVADDAGDITISRLYGVKTVFDLSLHIPIQTLIVSPGNTHLLVPLRDGRIVVCAVAQPSANKKHFVLNV